MGLFPCRLDGNTKRSHMKLSNARIVYTKQQQVFMQIIKILQIRTENTDPGRNQTSRRLLIEINQSAAACVCEEGQTLKRALRRLKRNKSGCVALEDHLPHPHDIGLLFHDGSRYSKREPFALPSFSETRHQA